MKEMGYKTYQENAHRQNKKPKILRFYNYPHYMKKLFHKILG